MGNSQALVMSRGTDAVNQSPSADGALRVRVPGTGASSEVIWAAPHDGEEDLFEVLSLPFVTPGLAFGDLIAAFGNPGGYHELVMVVTESPYSVFSVIAHDAVAVQADLSAAFSHLDDVLVETNGDLGAIGCLPADYAEISEYLERGERAGRWCYAVIADRASVLGKSDFAWQSAG